MTAAGSDSTDREQGPLISIVSPSFNQVAFVRQTIDSVAAQDYATKEHIIVDGLSTDGTVDEIEAAASSIPHLRAIVEPDRGQADAINKGFTLASGEILAWLNTDDYYADPGALSAVAEYFRENPDVDIIWGRGLRVDPERRKLAEAWVQRPGTDFTIALQHSMGLLQPSVFFRRRVFLGVGGLDERYPLQLDYEYWIRIAKAGFRFGFLDRILSHALVHEDAKSTAMRMEQLNECLRLVGKEFGYVPIEWIHRFGEFLLTRQDHKITRRLELDETQERESAAIDRALLLALNGDERTRTLLRSAVPDSPAAKTMDAMREHGLEPALPRRIVITAFDSAYYRQGLNLIASLHRTSYSSFDEILVYSLHLTEYERTQLSDLAKVKVRDLPDEVTTFFPDYVDPKSRAYKSCAIRSSTPHVVDGDLVLWMDAGLAPLRDIAEIFDLIDSEHFFITNHDDKRAGLVNINFAHPESHAPLAVTNADLLAEHLCSAILGYKRGGRYQRIIEQAYELGQIPEIVMWPKVPPEGRKYKPRLSPKERGERDALIAGTADPDSVSYERLCYLCDYYGHRTQIIYSVLAHRAGAPIFSARTYRRSNDRSSAAAIVNWTDSPERISLVSSDASLEGMSESVVVYHHRGILDSTEGLRRRPRGDALLVVGNGPSLKDFPFERLRDKAWLGMNAAYRYWEQVGIYPTYYACFDEVVLDSHSDQIIDLIARRRELGIRKFFLRRSVLEARQDLKDDPGVYFLEDLQEDLGAWFLEERITTGSVSVVVGWFLGYRDLYLLGIDLSYVEKLPEAVVDGRTLTLSADPADNPNYFFDGYQRRGDRYNPPNRHPGMHLRAWTQVADLMADFPITITNLNPASGVKDFNLEERGYEPTMTFLESRERFPQRLAGHAAQQKREQRYWRQSLLARIPTPVSTA